MDKYSNLWTKNHLPTWGNAFHNLSHFPQLQTECSPQWNVFKYQQQSSLEVYISCYNTMEIFCVCPLNVIWREMRIKHKCVKVYWESMSESTIQLNMSLNQEFHFTTGTVQHAIDAHVCAYRPPLPPRCAVIPPCPLGVLSYHTLPPCPLDVLSCHTVPLTPQVCCHTRTVCSCTVSSSPSCWACCSASPCLLSQSSRPPGCTTMLGMRSESVCCVGGGWVWVCTDVKCGEGEECHNLIVCGVE